MTRVKWKTFKMRQLEKFSREERKKERCQDLDTDKLK